MIKKLAQALQVMGALLWISAGTLYITRSEFMPYHAQVVGMDWSSIEPHMQALILSFLRVVGASQLACGAALLWLLVPMRRGERWPAYASLSIALVQLLPTLYVAATLRTVSPAAQTPAIPTAILLVILLVGSILHLHSVRTNNAS